MGFHFSHKAIMAKPGRLAEQVVANHAVLIEFAEEDAPTCRLEEPILSQILRYYADRLKVIQADVKSSPDDAATHQVSAVPTFLLFIDGKETLRLVGYQSVDTLIASIDGALTAAEQLAD